MHPLQICDNSILRVKESIYPPSNDYISELLIRKHGFYDGWSVVCLILIVSILDSFSYIKA